MTRLAANDTAANMSLRLAELASTSMIVALGAIAWAHWMSREISISQPESYGGGVKVVVPNEVA